MKEPLLEAARELMQRRGFEPTQVRFRDKIRRGTGRHTNLIDVFFEEGKGPHGLTQVTLHGDHIENGRKEKVQYQDVDRPVHRGRRRGNRSKAD
jgi:hypothetical protein